MCDKTTCLLVSITNTYISQKQTIFDWRLSLFSKGLKWPTKAVFWDEQPQLHRTNPSHTHTRLLQDFSLTSLAEHFIMVFRKFTALFDHRHRFFLCRENNYGSSMIQCIYQLSSSYSKFGKDLVVVIVQLRSAEPILKRVKSVNHCCKERISMHCYSDPHFSKDSIRLALVDI